GGLDVIAKRFLLGFIFLDASLDDVADRDQADHLTVLDHGQVAELAERHHLHEPADRVGLAAADDLARHHRADRLIQHPRAALAEHAHDVAFRQDALHAALAHDQPGADFALA